MANDENSKRDEASNFLWEEFKIRVETYKSYLNIALQANVFFYVTTGAVLAFYFNTTTKPSPFLDFILLLPILIGAVLGGIFVHAAKLQKEASIIIENIRWKSDKKGYSIAELPDINLLYLLLLIFGCIFILVAISLIIVPHILSTDPKNVWYFTGISSVILIVGVFSIPITYSFSKPITYSFDGILRETEKPSWRIFQNLNSWFWKEKFRSLNGEMVVKALINEHNEADVAFWDTSAILLLCFSWIYTIQFDELRELQRKYPKIVVWSKTSDEIEICLANLERDRILSKKEVVEAKLAWGEIIKSSQIVESVERVVTTPDTLSERYGLRKSDSLQLAAAIASCQGIMLARPFITANEKLAEAAEKEGFTKILLT